MMTLGGSFTTNIRHEMEIRLAACRNKTGSQVKCASIAEQEEYFKYVDFQVRYVNSYFDFDDFKDPINQFIDDRLYFPVEPFQKKLSQIFVKQSFADLNDSVMRFKSASAKTFLSVDNI